MRARLLRGPFSLGTGVAFASILVLGAIAAAPLFAQKPAQKPGDVYLAYVAAMEKMKSIQDVVAFMPADQVAMMKKLAGDKALEKELVEEAKKELVTGVKVLKESPYRDGALLELEGTKKATNKKVTGWAQMVAEGGAWKVAKDDWSGAPPPAAPKIPATVKDPGRAEGELTVQGQTAKLSYAYAVAEPDSFDKTKTAYKVVLSDQPWNPKDYNVMQKVSAGTLHYVELSIGGKNQIYGAMLHHKGFKSGTMSSAGSGHVFEAEKLGPDVVAGRAYLEGPQKPMDETFYYAATFRAPVSK